MHIPREAYGVIFGGAFAVVVQEAPISDNWKPFWFLISALILVFSGVGWICSHFDSIRRYRHSPSGKSPMILFIVGCAGAIIAISVWLFMKPIDDKKPDKEIAATGSPSGNQFNAPINAPGAIFNFAPNSGTQNITNIETPPLVLKWTKQAKQSDSKEFPFRVDVVVTPNVEFHPVSFIIVCDNEIKQISPLGLFFSPDFGITSQDNKIGFVYYSNPGLATNVALTVAVLSDKKFNVLEVKPAKIAPRRNVLDPQ